MPKLPSPNLQTCSNRHSSHDDLGDVFAVVALQRPRLDALARLQDLEQVRGEDVESASVRDERYLAVAQEVLEPIIVRRGPRMHRCGRVVPVEVLLLRDGEQLRNIWTGKCGDVLRRSASGSP